jgi:hypothetical protein
LLEGDEEEGDRVAIRKKRRGGARGVLTGVRSETKKTKTA